LLFVILRKRPLRDEEPVPSAVEEIQASRAERHIGDVIARPARFLVKLHYLTNARSPGLRSVIYN
jgi:hypothetical protein